MDDLIKYYTFDTQYKQAETSLLRCDRAVTAYHRLQSMAEIHFDSMRDIVVSWYDTIDDCIESLLQASGSKRYEDHTKYLARMFGEAVLRDRGKALPIQALNDTQKHNMEAMVWAERGIFTRLIEFN